MQIQCDYTDDPDCLLALIKRPQSSATLRKSNRGSDLECTEQMINVHESHYMRRQSVSSQIYSCYRLRRLTRLQLAHLINRYSCTAPKNPRWLYACVCVLVCV